MRAKIIFSPFVKDDLKNGKDWYNKIDKKLASRFLNEYRENINFISENPSSKEIRYGNLRISYLTSFPFGIHYEFIENENTITVYSVFHTSRNPKIWKKRK